MAVSPHLDKTNNDRRTPEKDSRRPAGEFSAHSAMISRITGAVILGLFICQSKRRVAILLATRLHRKGMRPALRDVPLQRLGDLLLRHRSYDLLDDLPVLEQQQRGNSLNAIPAR